jgi:hypothetical protein
MTLLIEAIPVLVRSKTDLLLFFRGAGVGDDILRPFVEIVKRDRDSISKYRIVRNILATVNDHSDRYLGLRREILKRVVEYDDFSSAYPEKRLEAEGYVAKIRSVVNVKDSFTRMNIERERERQQRVADEEGRRRAVIVKRKRLDSVRKDLFQQFSAEDPQQRGRALEKILTELFEASEILVREPFTVNSSAGDGITEQIDGAIEFDGHLYLVEIRWWSKPLGQKDVSPHIVKVYNRAGARGLIISANGFTKPAIDVTREALQQRVIMLMSLQEITTLLENASNLTDVLREKSERAITDKDPNFSAW